MSYYQEQGDNKSLLSTDGVACRMCLEVDPAEDRIKPCACTGSVGLVHRECLDRWRSLSPHPNALSQCELCKTAYKMVYKDEESDCWRKTRYGIAITMDVLFFIALFAGLYLLSGWVGDVSLNKLVIDIFCERDWITHNITCHSMPFLQYGLWEGRIWFYGFCVFFFCLGVIGCIFACCCKDDGTGGDYGHNRYSRPDCWWVCCGPAYYNGYYYYSPYGFWGPGDLCCWMCFWDMHFHHHGMNLAGCANCCSGCSGVGSNCGEGGNQGALVLLILVLIVIAIFILVGVIFGAILSFMIMGKIIRRHMSLLERRANARTYMVADLNNPAQVAEADRQQREGRFPQLDQVVVEEQLPPQHSINNPYPKGKGFDNE